MDDPGTVPWGGGDTGKLDEIWGDPPEFPKIFHSSNPTPPTFGNTQPFNGFTARNGAPFLGGTEPTWTSSPGPQQQQQQQHSWTPPPHQMPENGYNGFVPGAPPPQVLRPQNGIRHGFQGQNNWQSGGGGGYGRPMHQQHHYGPPNGFVHRNNQPLFHQPAMSFSPQRPPMELHDQFGEMNIRTQPLPWGVPNQNAPFHHHQGHQQFTPHNQQHFQSRQPPPFGNNFAPRHDMHFGTGDMGPPMVGGGGPAAHQNFSIGSWEVPSKDHQESLEWRNPVEAAVEQEKKWRQRSGIMCWGDPTDAENRKISNWQVEWGKEEDLEEAMRNAPRRRANDSREEELKLPFPFPLRHEVVPLGWDMEPKKNLVSRDEQPQSGDQGFGSNLAAPDRSPWDNGGLFDTFTSLTAPTQINDSLPMGEIYDAMDAGHLTKSVKKTPVAPAAHSHIRQLLQNLPELTSVEKQLDELLNDAKVTDPSSPEKDLDDEQKVHYNNLIVRVSTARVQISALNRKIDEAQEQYHGMPVAELLKTIYDPASSWQDGYGLF